jgi:lipid II:glycine glycyltransferase (peptidoglycan interpeptide bridge formation enzyme)
VWEHDICKQHRRKIRTATKRGLTVVEDNTEAALEAYYPLYLESCLRLGLLATEPLAFFYDLRALLGQHYSLLLARVGGEAVAGLIVFNCGDKVFAYQIASAARHWDYFPNHLLFSSAIERACAAGAAYIDFLPTGDHLGPELFKERFGAQRLPYRTYRVHNRVYAAAVEVKDRLTHAEPKAPAAPAPPAPPDELLEAVGEGE